MSEPATVTPLHAEQLQIDGFPVLRGRTLFSLRGVKKHPTDKVLAHKQNISGTFKGRVVAAHFDEIGNDLHAEWIVEVLEVDVDG